MIERPEKHFRGIHEIMLEALKKQTRAVNEHLEWVARTYSEPPIKGEITKGKLKWRGLRLCKHSDEAEIVYWIEQRGKKIGPTLKLTSNISL